MTKFTSPSGKLNLMKLSEFEKEFSTHKLLFNKLTSKLFGVDIIDNKLKDLMIQNAIRTEITDWTKLLKEVNLLKYPDVLPEAKLSNLFEYIDTRLDGDPTLFLEILHKYNQDNPGTYQWFEDWITPLLDYDLQKSEYDKWMDVLMDRANRENYWLDHNAKKSRPRTSIPKGRFI